MSALFGPSGNSREFYDMGFTQSLQAPEFVRQKGLDVFEYQCGRGVHIGEATARAFGEEARRCGVGLSIHAPYFISLASLEEEKRDNSIRYVLQSAQAARYMGAVRIVLHPGGLSKMSREEAFALASQTLRRILDAMDDAGYGDITLCPETMGKINQLGDLNEVMGFCELDERLVPCIDFGHLNSRTLGGLKSKEDFAQVLREIENRLGRERLHAFHAHFSKIEYSKGGEKVHLTFADQVFGPDYRPLMELIAEQGLSPRIMCESAGTQSQDAAAMKEYYLKYRESL